MPSSKAVWRLLLISCGRVWYIHLIFQLALRIPTYESHLMRTFVTLFEGTTGNCIPVDATVTNANVATNVAIFLILTI